MTREEAISALKNTAWIGTDKKVGEVEKAIMMAIEVLKAQNVTDTNVGNNDLISRSDAIDAIKGLPTWWADEGGYYGGARPPMEAMLDPEDTVSAIENLPSAQPKQRWIPCSERLPEVYKDVLICWDFKGNREVLIGNMYSDGTFHGYDDEYLTPNGRKYRKAVAWMPLPEPYREERTEE